VATGQTGHAEVARVVFDPEVLPLSLLLKAFFTVHDPTQKDRQGPDVGTQYRSAIFYENPAQLPAIEQAIAEVEAALPRPVVTEVAPLDRFWPAEEYHRRYFEKNPDQPYCRLVVAPKVQKVRRHFVPYLKSASTG
jgi:peptide-methionine (S)-S-oxide reductase